MSSERATQPVAVKRRRWPWVVLLVLLILGGTTAAVWFIPSLRAQVAQRLPFLNLPAAPATAVPQQPLAGLDWQLGPSAPNARSDAQGAIISDTLYVLGGDVNAIPTTSTVAFNLQTQTWRQLAPLPEPVAAAALAVDGTSIYMLGGRNGGQPNSASQHVWRYDITTDTWSAGPDLPAPRAAGSAARLGRELHMLGGVDTSDQASADHFVLNLDGGTEWEARAALPTPRSQLGSAAVGAALYAIGGQSGSDASTALTRVDRYDPTSDSWTRRADLPIAQSHIGASTRAYNNQILVVGGCCAPASAPVLLYDPQANIWLNSGALPEAHTAAVADVSAETLVVATGTSAAPTDTLIQAQLANTWLEVAQTPLITGASQGGIIANVLYISAAPVSTTLGYNLSFGTWSGPHIVAARPYTSSGQTSSVLGDQLYQIGGRDTSGGRVQRFRPQGNRWETLAPAPYTAADSAAVVQGGLLYLLGGISGSQPTTQTALYDPGSDSWTPFIPLPEPRAAAASDGSTIYLFGGQSSAGEPSRSIFIYDQASASWQPGPSELPAARSGMTAVYISGRFYLLGGSSASGPSARVDIYDPQSNTWSVGPDLPQAQEHLLVASSADTIYVGADQPSAANPHLALWLYRPIPSQAEQQPIVTAGAPQPTTEATPTSTLIPLPPTATPVPLPPNGAYLPTILK